jgi:hypothetical protein
MVAWIRAGNDQGALGPARGNVCYFPRARTPVRRDAAWLPGFVMAVIREPWVRPGIVSVVSSELAHLNISRTLLI